MALSQPSFAKKFPRLYELKAAVPVPTHPDAYFQHFDKRLETGVDVISVSAIEAALNAEDVEGLLALGAPADEYDSEAAMITEILASIPRSDRTEDAVIAAVSTVWGRMFGGSPAALEERRPAFRRIAQRLREPQRTV